MNGVQIRPSQFILTYGVGAIVDTRDGPNVVQDFEKWGQLFSNSSSARTITDFEIIEENLTVLLSGGKIFRIPTNAELDKQEDKIIYRTALFPSWAKCEEHDILYPLTQSGLTGCSRCPPEKRAQKEAIRFIRACSNGHMDDIDWEGIIHKKKACPNRNFKWIEPTSGDIRNVRIKCEKCGSEITLWDVYAQTKRCSGFSPESNLKEKCSKEPVVVLRSASNLRIPVILTALTIPPKCTRLHNVLALPTIKVILSINPAANKKTLLSTIEAINTSNPDLIKQATIDTINEYTDKEVEEGIKESRIPVDPNLTPISLKEKEFDALKYAAIHGYPKDPKRPEDFEVEKGAFNIVELPKLKVRITPVKRLRIVMVQKGYQRYVRPKSVAVENFNPKVVEKHFFDGHDSWYPGVATLGEGIFIDLPPREVLRLDTTYKARWMQEFERTNKQVTFNPSFVFWHSFSHRVIQALGLDSGYSSSSIRERIFFSTKSGDGGFLLYTSQPGGDGSLGGLIALTDQFSSVIETALRNIDACSNDPLCEEQVLTHGKANGAACYACLFLSETSCEHRNLFLDRNLLRKSV